MSRLLRKVSANTSNVVETKSLSSLKAKTGNLYESIAVISKRANQISAQIKEELHGKLQEFANDNDTLEEVFENREQIEISSYYERMPKPSVIATEEYIQGKVYFKKPANNG